MDCERLQEKAKELDPQWTLKLPPTTADLLRRIRRKENIIDEEYLLMSSDPALYLDSFRTFLLIWQ